MLQRTLSTGHSFVAGSLAFEPAGNAVWGLTAAGEIVTVRLADARVDVHGSGYVDPVAVVPLADGLTVAVAEAAGELRRARWDAADRATARVLATVPGGAIAAAAHPDPADLLVLASGSLDGGTGPELLTCHIDTGDLTALAGGLAGARAVTVDPTRRTATVLAVTDDGSGTLTTVDLDSGAVTSASGLPTYEHLTASPDPAQPGVLVSADATTTPRLVLLDPDGNEVDDESLPGAADGLVRWGSLVLVSCGTDLVAVEWGIDDGELGMEVPLGPLFVSGYARIAVDLPSAGLAAGEVGYSVREGEEAAGLSAGWEPPDPGGAESVMLLAGVHPGEYHLDATRVADGRLLATRRFRVTTLWPDEEIGPPVAITGNHGSTLMSWGGSGAGGSYFQPAPSLWRLLVVLVFLKDREWDGLEDAARADWKDRVIGPGESVRRFYEEVSAYAPGTHGTTVDLVGDQVFGPVRVDAGWGDVFQPRKSTGLNDGWKTKPTGYAVLAGAISDFFVDQPGGAQQMDDADSIVIVVRSGSDGPTDLGPMLPQIPTRYVWGHANETDFYWKRPTLYTQGKKPVTLMTDAYPAGAERNRTYTLCHEIGHNLGLADLYDAGDDYPAEVNARRPQGVDIMSTSQDLPHFSIANRIRLGWVDRTWLQKFDFTANPTGGSVVLQATETLTGAGPTAGRRAGIEVPVMDDWSYFFEYRNEQPGQISDQRLETEVVLGRTQILVGTDLRVRGGEVARPPILLLGDDPDSDGPLLVNDGQDYRDSDTSNPDRMHDFTLTLTDIAAPDGDSARVDVTYLAAHRPQLQVRPAPGRGNFKSPDIEISSPLPFLVGPIKGVTNALKITVHNRGSLPAEDTQIHVRWLPFTVTQGPWTPLPDPAPFPVPASGLTSLVVPWPLPASVLVGDVEAQHFCVRVEIDRYRDPAHPEHEEIVVHDNWAQSNFDAGSIAFGSPSERVTTAAGAANTLARTATYLFTADQSSAWYRVFLGHAWLRLGAAEERPVELAYESLAGDGVMGSDFEENLERITATVDHVGLSSRLMPEGTECDSPRDVFGAGLDLRAGRRTWIEEGRWHGELVTARVQSRHDGVTSDVTFGEFHLATWPDDEPERVAQTVGEVSDGFGRVRLSDDALAQLAEGRRVWFLLGRPADNVYALARTEPERLG